MFEKLDLNMNEIAQDYIAGIPAVEIARKWNCHGRTIRRRLQEHGIALRGPKHKPKDAPFKNRLWLHDNYIVQQRTMMAIADELQAHYTTIRYYLVKFHIPIREDTLLVGARHPNWVGGRMMSNKRWRVLLPKDSPFISMAHKSGYVQEHRLIAAIALGRPLKTSEIVHHINGDKADNRNCNLVIMDHGFHTWLHKVKCR